LGSNYTQVEIIKNVLSNISITNQWHHIAITKSSGILSLTTKIYVDGVNYPHTVFNYDCTPNVAVTRVNIGSGFGLVDTLYPYTGLVDEARIYNRTLTANEVKQLFYSNLAKFNNTHWELYVNQSNITNGTYNYSLNYFNMTGSSFSTGQYFLTMGSSEPALTLISPLTNSSSSIVNFNISIDSLGDTCRVSTNNGTTNITMTRNGNIFNFTNTSMPNGNYSIRFRCNNSMNKNVTLNITNFVVDTIFPRFQNITSNSPIYTAGVGIFNVTVNQTNGTVLLEINGVNVTATKTGTFYNASYTFTTQGTYIYKWWAFGNGTIRNANFTSATYQVMFKVPFYLQKLMLQVINNQSRAIMFTIDNNGSVYVGGNLGVVGTIYASAINISNITISGTVAATNFVTMTPTDINYNYSIASKLSTLPSPTAAIDTKGKLNITVDEKVPGIGSWSVDKVTDNNRKMIIELNAIRICEDKCWDDEFIIDFKQMRKCVKECRPK
jgi:hypothetical protein